MSARNRRSARHARHPHLAADRPVRSLMGEPVGEGDDVTPAQRRRILTVISGVSPQARRQLAEDGRRLPWRSWRPGGRGVRQIPRRPTAWRLSRSHAWLIPVNRATAQPETARSHTSLRRSSSGVVVARCTAVSRWRARTAASWRPCLISDSSRSADGGRLGPAEHRHDRPQRRDQRPDAPHRSAAASPAAAPAATCSASPLKTTKWSALTGSAIR